jgi:hypothetical protein
MKAKTDGAEQERRFGVNDLAGREPGRKEGKYMDQLDQVPMADVIEEGDAAINQQDRGETVIPILRVREDEQGDSDRHAAIQ